VFARLISTSLSIHDDFSNEQMAKQGYKPVEVISEGGKHILRMSFDDTFVVEETEEWHVDVQESPELPFVTVFIRPKKDKSFSMELCFRRDTPNLAKLNSGDKIKNFVMAYSSSQYVPQSSVKRIELKPLNIKGWYGWYTVLTDSESKNKDETSEGEFKYVTTGTVRLSSDSVLIFTIMTNELDTPKYKKLFDFTCSFIKDKKF